MRATYCKLADDSWGIRVTEGIPTVGTVVIVAKKSGETKSETVASVLSTTKGVSVCTIRREPRAARTSSPNWDPDRFNGYGKKKGGFRKACITGGNCSSFGSGKSCGGLGCDGWE